MRIINTGDYFGSVRDGVITPLGLDVMAFYADPDAFKDVDPAAFGLPSAVPLEDVILHSPVPRPSKILGVGPNYLGHAAEATVATAASVDDLGWFAAFSSSVIGPGEDIRIPAGVREIDIEAEIGVVIGRPAHNVTPGEAGSHIAGFVCLNDVSARELQRRNSLRGKAIDTFFPIGPYLVTPDELGSWQGRAVRSYVNGQCFQDGSTGDMVFGVEELLSSFSRLLTLEPGDVIATGTPAGTPAYSNPPRYLQDGDIAAVSVEGLGRLENRVRQC
ncbi:MAG: fumarylacetoacetate hydrolase family protein [Streptosporangiaceae bacterium]